MNSFSLKHAEVGFEDFPNFEIFRKNQIKTQKPFKGFDPLVCSDGFIHAEENETRYYISLIPQKPLSLAYRYHWCEGCGGDEYFSPISDEKLLSIKEKLRKNISQEQWSTLQLDQAFEQAITAPHKERPFQQYYASLKEIQAFEKTRGYPYLKGYPYLCVADDQTPHSLDATHGDIILYTQMSQDSEHEIFTLFKDDKAYFSTYRNGVKHETTTAEMNNVIRYLSYQLEGKDVSLLEPLLNQAYQEQFTRDIHKNLEKIATQQNNGSQLSQIHPTRNLIYSGITGFLLTFGKITERYFSKHIPSSPALIKYAQIKKPAQEQIHINS